MSREDAQLKIWLPFKMRDLLKSSAALHSRSMNAEIVSILEAHLSSDASLPSLVERLEAAVKALEARP